jgi:hypothetical protein
MGQKKDKKYKKTQQLPKMCLNMIVKNESHIITETLTNILKYIDYWVISDTGSTDGTQDIIKKFFKEKGIPGELVEHEWKNFGHNRTMAFEAAYNKSEYVWVIDADDLIVGDLNIPKNMDRDMYLLKYGGVNLCYPRAQIFNNKLKWIYRGVLHEFAKCANKEKNTSLQIDGNYYIDSRRLGDRNKDPQKYLKDANVLVKAIKDKIDPDLKERYAFYAGQSFRDCNDLENCIKYYEKRTKMGGWFEEICVSYMEMGNAMIKLNYPKKDIVDTFMNGFKAAPARAECLFLLSNYYLQNKDIEDAYKTCKIASKIPNPTNLLLFIKTDVHIYKCKELLYIIYCLIQKNKLEIKKLTNEIIENEKNILYDFLTTSLNVPDEIKYKIKNIKENEHKIFIEPDMLDDYMFIDNLDSFGDDIGCFDNKSIKELEDIASLYDNCIGFNTYGYLKHTINLPLVILPNRTYLNDGVYIKKELAIQIIKKYGTNLVNIPEKVSLTVEDIINSENQSTESTESEDSEESEEIIEIIKNNKPAKIIEIIETNEPTETIEIIETNEPTETIEINDISNDYYNNKLVKQILEHVQNVLPKNKKITLSITTCKRLNLFKRTMNSFINCCSDILLIDEYICVDDNSSEEDRNEMRKLYPFFTWIMKTPEQKGHMQSMNIIIENVKTEYLLHMEDDWLFLVKDNYISPSIEILNQQIIKSLVEIPKNREIEKKRFGQVVFNKSYTELPENEVDGGFLCETNENNIKYLIHEHYNPNTENELYETEVKKYRRSSMYWPHFSLHPSIIKTEVFKNVGNFDTNNQFFEREFANKYYVGGNYVTCFLNRVSCKHIGKLLSQRTDTSIKNAYELNGVNQFNEIKKTEIELGNYIFYPNKDSVDYDIVFVPNKTINELINIADSIPSCIGFNTFGYFKYKIVDKENFIFLPNIKNIQDGLFVKK